MTIQASTLPQDRPVTIQSEKATIVGTVPDGTTLIGNAGATLKITGDLGNNVSIRGFGSVSFERCGDGCLVDAATRIDFISTGDLCVMRAPNVDYPEEPVALAEGSGKSVSPRVLGHTSVVLAETGGTTQPLAHGVQRVSHGDEVFYLLPKALRENYFSSFEHMLRKFRSHPSFAQLFAMDMITFNKLDPQHPMFYLSPQSQPLTAENLALFDKAMAEFAAQPEMEISLYTPLGITDVSSTCEVTTLEHGIKRISEHEGAYYVIPKRTVNHNKHVFDAMLKKLHVNSRELSAAWQISPKTREDLVLLDEAMLQFAENPKQDVVLPTPEQTAVEASKGEGSIVPPKGKKI